MMLPTAPVVPMDLGDDFKFGPTVLDPIQPEDNNDLIQLNGFPSVETTGGDIALSQLGVLAKFHGTYSGFGFNTIFRPNGTKTPTPLPILPPSEDPADNILQLNLTSEAMAFSKGLTDVPNRGLDTQADLMLNGVPYTQTIADITELVTPPKKQPVIHFEPGLWMHVPASQEMPVLPASLSRMAAIPHGTSINVQSFQPTVTSKGAPNFPPVDITPIVVGQTTKIAFRSQTASNNNTPRLPQNLAPFMKAGTITQDILNNPNTVLRNANKGKTIVENTTFAVSSLPDNPDLGGGTSNIGFLVGADGGANTATVQARSANANSVKVTAQYWLSKIRTKIELPVVDIKTDKKKFVSPASSGSRDAVPKFLVDMNVPAAKTVNVEYTQIQYTQTVFLDFNGLSWPHVTVGTLAPTAGHKLSQVIVTN
ncbi:uncharacterized protein B0J16DRAFT_183707 [Fusarium flagelliforme]|uniref:Uncharacterized protein n=1 Tax=Fusarium flagelliforme TaxID=2675880 RepID=A0A395M8G3_9HYPO|nr:uncharacterized protein B0J16DRAFT_183707 [Fusarium flagelliforme]KAH7174679.1 hypothetical protein B0J16DRAFT_183707 [Fusarium flagelliforme]RFN44192.1 hypothetical protein FIE12Z_11584 [Fusarium flagelliforme]